MGFVNAPRDLAAYLVSVGDELLNGSVLDTNTREIQQALLARGVAVRRTTATPDDAEAIAGAVDAAPAGSLVVLTGGLGPTDDDLTREAVAAWAGAALELDPELDAGFAARCAARGFDYREDLRREARVPAGMTPVTNPVGWAPALVGEMRGRWLVLLPGVPAEMRAMLPAALDMVAARAALPAPPRIVRLRTAQLAESHVARRCAPVVAGHPDLRWSWCLGPWGVDVTVVLPADAADRAAAVEAELRDALGAAVFAAGDASLPKVVQGLLVARGETLGAAESCTGGLLGAAMTDEPGASACFLGGIVSYADAVKNRQLGVSAEILSGPGAVSRECAEAMATGCRAALGSTHALALTGIAGPDGGSDEKPVGTTWIALASPSGVTATRFRFRTHRHRNRRLAVAAALDGLRRSLDGPEAGVLWPEDALGRS